MKSTAFFLILLAGSAAARTLNGDAKPAGLLDGILNPILGGNGTGGGVIGGIIGGDGGGIGGIIGGGGGLGGLVGGLLNGTLGGILPGLLPGNVLNTTSGLIPIGNIPIGNLIGGGGVLGGSGLDLTKTLGPLLGGILNGQLGGPLTGPILNQTLGQILGPGINISLTVSVQGAPCTALLQQRVRKALGAFVTKTLVFVKVDTTKCTASNGVATVVVKVNVPLPDLKALGIDTSAVTNLLNSLLGQVSDLVNIRKNSKDIGKLLNFARAKGFKITKIALQIGV